MCTGQTRCVTRGGVHVWTWMCHSLFHQCFVMMCLFLFFSCLFVLPLSSPYEHNTLVPELSHTNTHTHTEGNCHFILKLLCLKVVPSVQGWVCFTKSSKPERDLSAAERLMVQPLQLLLHNHSSWAQINSVLGQAWLLTTTCHLKGILSDSILMCLQKVHSCNRCSGKKARPAQRWVQSAGVFWSGVSCVNLC